MDGSAPLRLDRGVPPPPGDRAALVAALSVKRRRHDPGDTLCHEGDPDGELVVLTSGWACRCRHTEDGERQIVSLALPGDTLDLAPLSGMPIVLSSHALSPATTASLGRDALARLCASRPGVLRALLAEGAMESAAQVEALVGMGRRSSAERLAHVLHETASRARVIGLSDGRSLLMPVTQADIGDMVGLTTVHVNRTFHALRQEGLVDSLGRRILFPDPEGLRARSRVDMSYLRLPEPTPPPEPAGSWQAGPR